MIAYLIILSRALRCVLSKRVTVPTSGQVLQGGSSIPPSMVVGLSFMFGAGWACPPLNVSAPGVLTPTQVECADRLWSVCLGFVGVAVGVFFYVCVRRLSRQTHWLQW